MMAATLPGDRLSSAPVTSAVNSPEPRVVATFPIANTTAKHTS